MIALSIRQPWAWLIAAGHKDIENRTWPTGIRGTVLIHAAKQHDGPRDEWDWPGIKAPERMEYGGIIGSMEIVDCVKASPSPWFEGPYGFVIRNARQTTFRPWRGQLGFFSVPPTCRTPHEHPAQLVPR